MPTEQISGMTSDQIDDYWQYAVQCEKCKHKEGLFSSSRNMKGYLKIVFSWKWPFISKKWFCSSCYDTVGGILLGFGDLKSIEKINQNDEW